MALCDDVITHDSLLWLLVPLTRVALLLMISVIKMETLCFSKMLVLCMWVYMMSQPRRMTTTMLSAAVRILNLSCNLCLFALHLVLQAIELHRMLTFLQHSGIVSQSKTMSNASELELNALHWFCRVRDFSGTTCHFLYPCPLFTQIVFTLQLIISWLSGLHARKHSVWLGWNLAWNFSILLNPSFNGCTLPVCCVRMPKSCLYLECIIQICGTMHCCALRSGAF
jgi:hypothetical protein